MIFISFKLHTTLALCRVSPVMRCCQLFCGEPTCTWSPPQVDSHWYTAPPTPALQPSYLPLPPPTHSISGHSLFTPTPTLPHHPKPYTITLHPSPHTLLHHPTPYTHHPTPYSITPHPTPSPHTLLHHPTPYSITPHPTPSPHTLLHHPTPYSITPHPTPSPQTLLHHPRPFIISPHPTSFPPSIHPSPSPSCPLSLTGGKKCLSCKERIFHDRWKTSPKVLEERWAHQEAKKRELQEVSDFLGL